jgi:cytochrome P450
MSQGTTPSTPYNLLDPEVIANPYPLYQRLRSEAPVYWHEGMQAWLISRYADVTSLLRDQRFSSKLTSPDQVEREERRQIEEMMSDLLLFSDPPAHTRLRSLLELAFDSFAQRMRPRIEQITDGLLDAIQDSGRMDIIGDLADPLIFTVLTEFLGVPVNNGVQFRQWMFSFFALMTNAPTTPEQKQEMLQNLVAMTDYFRGIIKQRLKEPKEDVISALIQAEKQGDKLSQQQLLINSILLLIGGHAPTINMLGNGLLALLRHPDQIQKLADNPILIESAVEELLRYDCSLHWATRRATEDIKVHEQLIRKGQIALFGLGSANHDQTQFPDCNNLDISRTVNRHLAFGDGPHACIGVPLLRPQLQISINTILRRLKRLRLETDSLEWVGAPIFRGLKFLPVTFELS